MNLTRQERKLLVKVMEECGELIQICAKTLQYGKTRHNIGLLHEEAGDVRTTLKVAHDVGLLSRQVIQLRVKTKYARVVEQIGA